MDQLTSFIPLLLAIWATFQPGTGTIKYLNEMRDKMLEGADRLTLAHLRLLYADWKGILLGYIGYQAFILILIILFAWQISTREDLIGRLLLAISIGLVIAGIVRLYREWEAAWRYDRPAIESILSEKH